MAAWREFAREVGGEFVKGDPWWKVCSGKRDKLMVPVNPWTLTFDTAWFGTDTPTLVTRVRAPYVAYSGRLPQSSASGNPLHERDDRGFRLGEAHRVYPVLCAHSLTNTFPLKRFHT